jgi:hypothetical protein
MITFPLIQPTIMIQFFIILSSFFHMNPPLNIDLLIILSINLLQHHFRPFPSMQDKLYGL